MNNGNYIDEADIELCPKYYSDHDALCISLNEIQENHHLENVKIGK